MFTGERAVDVRDPQFDPALLTADDQHILALLQKTVAACDENIDRCRFNDYAKAIYDFFWHEFCDWYVEYAKLPLNGTDEPRKAEVLRVMHYVLSRALCLLHPIMPFLTEELWQGMGYAAISESILTAPWPEALDEDELGAWGVHPEAVAYVDAKHAAIGLARNLRADYGLAPSQTADFVLRPADAVTGELVRADREAYLPYLKAGKLEVETDFTPAKPTPSVITPLGTLFMSLEGHVDVEAEKKRLTEQLRKTEQELEASGKRLDNVNFVSRAPAEVVEQARARKRELQEKRDKLAKLIEAMAAP